MQQVKRGHREINIHLNEKIKIIDVQSDKLLKDTEKDMKINNQLQIVSQDIKDVKTDANSNNGNQTQFLPNNTATKIQDIETDKRYIRFMENVL